MYSVAEDCVGEMFSSVAFKIGIETAEPTDCVVLPLGDIASNEFDVVSFL